MLGLCSPSQPAAHWWQGASGRWYYFSIHPITAIPSWIRECNYIFARPRLDASRTREPFYIGEKGDTDRFENHEKLPPALRRGATELHIYLLAKSHRERLDIETDIRHGHWTPLNEQPTRAMEPVNTLATLGGFGIGGGILGALGRLPPTPAPAPAPSFGGLGALSAFLQPNPFLDAVEPTSGLNALRGLGISR